MIDLFAIFNRGGVVLWEKQLSPTAVPGNPVDELIKKVLLEEKTGETAFRHGDHTLKWTLDNQLGLVYVACYLSFAQMSYIDDLLESVKKEFGGSFRDQLKPVAKAYDFDSKYDRLLGKYETKAVEAGPKKPRSFAESKKAQNVDLMNARISKKKKKKTGEGSKKKLRRDDGEDDSADDEDESGNEDDTNEESAEENEPKATQPAASEAKTATSQKPQPAASPKAKEAEDEGYEYLEDPDQEAGTGSAPSNDEGDEAGAFVPNADKLAALRAARGGRSGQMRGFQPKAKKKEPAKPASAGKPKKPGRQQEVVNEEDLDFSKKDAAQSPTNKYGSAEDTQIDRAPDSIYRSDDEESEDEKEDEPKKTGMFSFLSSLVTGKTLDRETLQPVLDKMRENLIAKNVAADIADKLCDSVAASLEGQKAGTFTTIRSIVKKNMEDALTRILTPKKSTDVLQGVLQAKQQGRPYTVVFVGVNGVGKSTSLSKLCAYFLSKGLKVMIAACDTFRAGAVEQLRTHARSLKVELFERGYNKDAASVCMDAVKEATRTGHDVVLVDTAGRMQDNEPLMRALSKLINLNKPDLVLFVGEALVGNDAVDQLTKFNRCLADLSTDNNPRLIDGIILTKFDTIDDKVGAAISMTYTTGQPIMFVGCGQTYGDLKKMNVRLLIKALLK